MKNAITIIKKTGAFLISRVGFNYLLAAIVLYSFVNYRTSYMIRMNNVSDWAHFPIAYAKGEGRMDDLDYRRAIRYYKMVDAALGGHSRSLGAIGLCYSVLEQNKKSIRYYEKALALEPRLFWLKYNLGVLYAKEGEQERAKKLFQEITEEGVESLIKYSIFADLMKFNEPLRKVLFDAAKMFAIEIYVKTQKHLADLNGPPEFLDMKSWALVLHPWVNVIPIGKEMFYSY